LLTPHILFVSGDDHHLRIPFMLALKASGFRISAASTGDPTPFTRAGLEHRAFRFARFVNPLADLAAIRALSAIFGDLSPDVVHGFDTKPNFIVPLAARSLPNLTVVRTINGLGWLFSVNSPAALALRPVYLSLHRLASSRTAATVFQNADDKMLFERRRLIGAGRSLLIPGSGVDLGRFDRDSALGGDSVRLRQTLGLGASRVVVTVSRMTRQKGIPTLLKAAALVHEVRPDVRFLLVGPRESEGRRGITRSEINRHFPYVLAIGPRSDVPALLGLADVFAFPTEYREGVPRVLLEAALARIPIVTTRMPGCSDVVRDGWTGFLVPPRTPRALAARILELLQNQQLSQQMAARAAALVRREFGLATIAPRYAALYTELLGDRNRGRFRNSHESPPTTSVARA
jgi:glycosyltransferase involved in cell wall biosynthesis